MTELVGGEVEAVKAFGYQRDQSSGDALASSRRRGRRSPPCDLNDGGGEVRGALTAEEDVVKVLGGGFASSSDSGG